MKSIIPETLRIIDAKIRALPTPIYIGFLTTEHRIGYGEVFISSKPITKRGVHHVFRLDRHFGVWCELREFMIGLSLYPRAIHYDGSVIDLNLLLREYRRQEKDILVAHQRVDAFVSANCDNTSLTVNSL
jgi:hypothetical protein